jgi:hypothetical protein
MKVRSKRETWTQARKKREKSWTLQQRVAEAHIGAEKHGYGQEKKKRIQGIYSDSD